MANKIVNCDLVDVNNDKGSMTFIADENDIATVVDAIEAASNAAMTNVDVSSPVSLALVTNNTPVEQNIETCKTRLVVRCKGADLGNLVRPFDFCQFSIPAPVGSLYPYNTAVPLAADIVSLVNLVRSDSGVQMSQVVSVNIER